MGCYVCVLQDMGGGYGGGYTEEYSQFSQVSNIFVVYTAVLIYVSWVLS